MEFDALRQLVIEALEALKARDIREVDVRGRSDVTDLMVVASGSSTRQVNALAAHVVEKAKEHGVRPLGVEGDGPGEWVLVDLGEIVVHVMLPDVRDFYNLERLWSVDTPNARDEA